jgi:glutamyl-tRNA synthetase
VGDFVLWRADGVPAYQLAVVADDAAMRVTRVVRGDDLLGSTARQILLYRALGARPPAWLHVPLLLGPDGARLSKRHGAVGVAALRARGVPAARVVGFLASSLGLVAPGRTEEVMPAELVASWDPARLPCAPEVIDADRLAAGP